MAIPMYLFLVGIGHIALALYWYDLTSSAPRDGQAFTGTMVLGAGFAVLAIVVALVVLPFERGLGALARGSLAALVTAAAMVGYTASRGYLMGGATDAPPCIAERGGPVCVPATYAGTYIADARPDVFVMLVATVAAYALAHIAARVRENRASVTAMATLPR